MVRLKEIAAAAGVSVMTVSKALRDKPDLSAATKERIRKLAAEMGYLPDVSAQGLRNRTTRLLGLVISASTNPVNARIVMAIEERAHELGYDLVIAHSLNRLPFSADSKTRHWRTFVASNFPAPSAVRLARLE